MNIWITITNPVSAKLDALGNAAGSVLDRALRRTGSKYRTFVRRNYLSGQFLKRRTGKLKGDMRVRKVRGRRHTFEIGTKPRLSNIYERGATIMPRTAQMLRFPDPAGGEGFIFTRGPVYLRPRPFMSASAAVFPFQPTFAEAADLEVAKEIKKQEVE